MYKTTILHINKLHNFLFFEEVMLFSFLLRTLTNLFRNIIYTIRLFAPAPAPAHAPAPAQW